MREILFRGKRVDNGGWVEGNLFIPDKPDTPTQICIGTNIVRISYDVIPETVGQYIGLTDCTGKKIFEGDIIRYSDKYDYNCYLESLDATEAYDDIDLGNIWTIDEVVYCINAGYPAFDLNRHDFEVNGLSELNESGNYFYEIIGNIYDNHELLRKDGDDNHDM